MKILLCLAIQRSVYLCELLYLVPQTFLQSNMMQMIFLSHNFCKIEVNYIRLQGVVCFLPFFVLLILFICFVTQINSCTCIFIFPFSLCFFRWFSYKLALLIYSMGSVPSFQ
jgi:hypothetical protein